MTSSTKPEVHNVSHCRQRTKPRSQITHTKNFVKFGLAVFDTGYVSGKTNTTTNKQTNRRTDTLIAILRTPRGEVTRSERYDDASLFRRDR